VLGTLEVSLLTEGVHSGDGTGVVASSERVTRMVHFGKPAMYVGEGGSIPFMHMFAEKFPKAQFCVAGVLGPGSNAHGPNEFLHMPTAKQLTLCVADVLATYATHG